METTTERLDFTCGGIRFVLKYDEDGQWDHNKHADKVVAGFSSETTVAQIEFVEVLCDLLPERVIPLQKATKAIQGAFRLANRQGCRTIESCDKDIIALGVLGRAKEDEVDLMLRGWGYAVGRDGVSDITYKRGIGPANHLPDGETEARWLRKAMSLCEDVENHINAWAENRRLRVEALARYLVARFAKSVERAWQSDPQLWAEYCTWALRRKEIVANVMETLSKTLGKNNPFSEEALLIGVLTETDIPTAPNHPARILFSELQKVSGWETIAYKEMISRRNGKLDVGKLVAYAARHKQVFEVLSGNAAMVEPLSWHEVDSDSCQNMLRESEELWEAGYLLRSFVFASEAPLFLWKTAFRELAEASFAAKSFAFAHSASSLKACLLESFDSGPSVWMPIHATLANAADRAFAHVTQSWYYEGGKLLEAIHYDLRCLLAHIKDKQSADGAA